MAVFSYDQETFTYSRQYIRNKVDKVIQLCEN